MAIDRQLLQSLVLSIGGRRRFTQDTPILPDVWLEFWEDPEKAQDLILNPRFDCPPGRVALKLREIIEGRSGGRTARDCRIAYNAVDVVAQLDLDTLVKVALPMTEWWNHLHEAFKTARSSKFDRRARVSSDDLVSDVLSREGWLEWTQIAALTGFLKWYRDRRREAKEEYPDDANKVKLRDALDEIDEEFAERFRSLLSPGAKWSELEEPLEHFFELRVEFHEEEPQSKGGTPAVLWTIQRNRECEPAVLRSREAIKADAAERVFRYDTSRVVWAIVDSGIDARHLAFIDRTWLAEQTGDEVVPDEYDILANSRIVMTYNFPRLRDLVAGDDLTPDEKRRIKALGLGPADLLKDLRRSVLLGRDVDWGLIEPIIRIPHTQSSTVSSAQIYQPPKDEHGTHVAGIIGGDWRQDDAVTSDEDYPLSEDLKGICPNIRLYDLRVFDDDGKGDEFTIMAALQFVGYLNRHRDRAVVHGVNLSLSLHHRVTNYACGRTPICLECERLVGDGVVVVAAAGNGGHRTMIDADGRLFDAYNAISIRDPGNADAVITVGATHRNRPHAYGVSYFSSRGPTGDGRAKPDLVAPGEKITAPVNNGRAKRMDGTSMAAPHVSGAAAILMARHPEMIGRPQKIKEVLCESATDLGRERHFQGAGMLDVLRALQSL